MANGDKPNTAGVLSDVVKALPTATSNVRPYLLSVSTFAVLMLTMPSLPERYSAIERIEVLFATVGAAGLIQFVGWAYERLNYRFLVFQQRPEERMYNQQAATSFPERVANPPDDTG